MAVKPAAALLSKPAKPIASANKISLAASPLPLPSLKGLQIHRSNPKTNFKSLFKPRKLEYLREFNEKKLKLEKLKILEKAENDAIAEKRKQEFMRKKDEWEKKVDFTVDVNVHSRKSLVDDLLDTSNKSRSRSRSSGPGVKYAPLDFTRPGLSRQTARIENYLATQAFHRDLRLEKLVHLYQSSASFVTYTNMDEKIEACLNPVTPASPSLSIKSMLDGRKRTLEMNWTANARNMRSPRLNALQRILTGQEDGIVSLDTIRAKAKRVAEIHAKREMELFEEKMNAVAAEKSVGEMSVDFNTSESASSMEDAHANDKHDADSGKSLLQPFDVAKQIHKAKLLHRRDRSSNQVNQVKDHQRA